MKTPIAQATKRSLCRHAQRGGFHTSPDISAQALQQGPSLSIAPELSQQFSF
jgi:hypothetical protein